MRGDHDFPSKIFCPTLFEKTVGEHFCVSKKLWYQKFSRRRRWGSGLGLGRGHHGFVEISFSHSSEKLRVEKFRYGKKSLWVRRDGGATVSSKI